MNVLASSILGLVLAGSNVFIAYSSYEYFLRVMPQWESILPTRSTRVLVEANGDPEKRKIRQSWGRYLVDDRKEKNVSWWKWAFRYMPTIKQKDSSFRNVKMGYSSTDANALNKVCGKLYDQDSLSEQEKKDIWRYCSIGRREIVTLDKDRDMEYGDYIKEEEKQRLVSTMHKSNRWWWAIRAAELEFTTNDMMELCEYVYTQKKLKTTLPLCALPSVNKSSASSLMNTYNQIKDSQ